MKLEPSCDKCGVGNFMVSLLRLRERDLVQKDQEKDIKPK